MRIYKHAIKRFVKDPESAVQRKHHTNSASACFHFLPVNKLYSAMEISNSVLIMLLHVLDGNYAHTEQLNLQVCFKIVMQVNALLKVCIWGCDLLKWKWENKQEKQVGWVCYGIYHHVLNLTQA